MKVRSDSARRCRVLAVSHDLAPDDSPDSRRRQYLQVGTLVAAVLALLSVTIFFVTRGSSGDASPSQTTPASAVQAVEPTIVSAEELAQVPQRVGHPIYWAGNDPSKALELTVLPDSSVLVRYLPKGQPAGADTETLTIATYPNPQAYSLVRNGADQPGAILVEGPGGTLVAAEGDQSKNAYFALEGVPLLMEVFDTKPGRALELVKNGQIQILQ